MDEILCEYVDGTMDRTVRLAFEECVRCDDHLARQVEGLASTRRLLREQRWRVPAGLRERVRRRLERHLPFARPVRPPSPTILVGTALAVVLAAGLMAGTTRHASLSVAAHDPESDTHVNWAGSANLWPGQRVDAPPPSPGP